MKKAAQEALAANYDSEKASRSSALQKVKECVDRLKRERTEIHVVRVERISRWLAEGAELAKEAGSRWAAPVPFAAVEDEALFRKAAEDLWYARESQCDAGSGGGYGSNGC